jgi:glutamate/aspartate transport system substrate-binding protein
MAMVLASPLAAQAQATFEKIKHRGWINVGYRVGAAPFSDQDAKGGPVGYSLEFCAPVVERLKAATGVTEPARYVAVATDQRFRMLTQGSIDILCDSTTDTAERRSTVDFSIPIFVDAVQVMVRTKDNIKSLDQLNGKSVVVIGSTTAPAVVSQYMTQKGASWQLARALNADAAIGQLQLGWASGYARDGVLLASQRAAGTAADYTILPDRLSSEPIALAFRKNDAAMRQLVDGAITASMQNGSMATWYDKWFVKSAPPAKPLGIPMSDELKSMIAKAK